MAGGTDDLRHLVPNENHYINLSEMDAVTKATTLLLTNISCQHIHIVSDNQSVVAYINHQGGTQSIRLSQMTEQLLMNLSSNQIHLSARHYILYRGSSTSWQTFYPGRMLSFRRSG